MINTNSTKTRLILIPGTCVEDELAVVGDPRIPELIVRFEASGQVTKSSVLVLHSDMSVFVFGPESVLIGSFAG